MVNEERTHERKESRKPHILLPVNLEDLKQLPEVLSRADTMDALNISYASVKRYVLQGILQA